MNKQKIPYEVPEAQSFVVRCEGVVCASPLKKFNSNNYTEYFDDDDDIDFVDL